MVDNDKSVLRFDSYLIEKTEFYINDSFIKPDSSIKIEFQIDHQFEILDNNTAVVTLNSKIFENALTNNQPFSLNVTISGRFRFEGEISSEQQQKFLQINATAILFPYLRSFISNITCNAGISPLILPPINIQQYIQSKESST